MVLLCRKITGNIAGNGIPIYGMPMPGCRREWNPDLRWPKFFHGHNQREDIMNGHRIQLLYNSALGLIVGCFPNKLLGIPIPTIFAPVCRKVSGMETRPTMWLLPGLIEKSPWIFAGMKPQTMGWPFRHPLTPLTEKVPAFVLSRFLQKPLNGRKPR